MYDLICLYWHRNFAKIHQKLIKVVTSGGGGGNWANEGIGMEGSFHLLFKNFYFNTCYLKIKEKITRQESLV